MRSLSVLLLLPGCATLDAFVFNPVHCSAVGPETCDGKDSPWDALCVPCDEPYDWQRDYDWMDGTLAPGESVRPIDPANVTQVPIPTDDGEGELDAWFLASHGEDPATAPVTVVYHHGNYASIEHYQPRVRMLYEAGYNVLIWDYRGYGKSRPDTAPTPEQHLADADTVLARARELAPDGDRLVAYGYSLGTITATAEATGGDLCALLLEAPLVSLASIANDNTTLSLGEQFFSDGLFDSAARLDDWAGPAFGMTGTADTTAPTGKVEALLARGPGPREVWKLPGVRHGISDGGIPEAGLTPYLERIRGFLDDQGCLGP